MGDNHVWSGRRIGVAAAALRRCWVRRGGAVGCVAVGALVGAGGVVLVPTHGRIALEDHGRFNHLERLIIVGAAVTLG